MSTSFFTSCTVLTTGCTLTQDDTGLTPVVDGYYSDYTDCFEVVSGVIIAVSTCTPTPLYKITSFVQGNNTSQVECNSATYNNYTEIIAFQLTETDGVTPKVNSTGANIVVNMLVNTSECFGETGSYPLQVIILPGQSVAYGENRGITNNCGGLECTTETETFSCYTSIVPSGIEPTVDFFPKCSCVSYTVSTTSSSGQSFAYTNCDGTGGGGNIGGVSGYEADTFCALEDSVVLTGAELTLTNNGPCP